MVKAARLRDLLEDILELAEEREDVEDRPGGEGVRPNAWMEVAIRCRDALAALDRLEAVYLR